MVKVAPYRGGHVIVYTSGRQFILSREVDNNNNNKVEYKLHQVQFISHSDTLSTITQLIYIPIFDNFLITITTPTSTLLQLRTLKLSSTLSDQQLSL